MSSQSDPLDPKAPAPKRSRRPPQRSRVVPRTEEIAFEAPPGDTPTVNGAAAEPVPSAVKLPPVAPPTTPPDRVPVPEPGPDGTHDLSLPGYYLNRELTWLNFNFRVLNEAEDARNPLLERLKFVAIVSNNLNEFIMKRIGGLKQQVGAGVQELTVDGRSPAQQIEDAYALVRELENRKARVLPALFRELRAAGIVVADYDELGPDERTAIREYYVQNIFPLVTPQATDPAHPFPFISNLSLNLLVGLRYPDDPRPLLARVKVPVGTGIPRFLQVPGKRIYVPLEGVMAHNLDLLFPDMEVTSCEQFRVTRNANTETDEERAEDLLVMIEAELRERKFAPIVRVEVQKAMAPLHRGMLAAELGLNENDDVFEVEGMLGMRDLWELCGIEDAELHDPPHHPVEHPGLTPDRNIFHVIRDAKSFLLHHPYESFSTSVGRFLREAARDPKVRAIKMSLYRTSADSNVIDSLIEAARNGKQVAVVVELKARFDEAANIQWANRMEEAGIHVTYGVMGLKTHCKVILVVRQDYDGLRRYAHIGTGNYHAGTARLYSDLGFLTCKRSIGQDLTELFNYLTTGYKPKRNYKKLLPAPKVLKRGLLDKIEREIGFAEKGEPALIRFKINALEDADITRSLYQACRAGVRVELLARDTCRLRPGVPGLSESATVVSVVGRFLEHSRIFHFRAGGADEYYIGSADCMKRNLESRVEVLVPVEAPLLKEQLGRILDLGLTDERNGWVMRADGSYVQRQPDPDRPAKGGSQAQLIADAEARRRDSQRLRRRSLRGIVHRNLR